MEVKESGSDRDEAAMQLRMALRGLPQPVYLLVDNVDLTGDLQRLYASAQPSAPSARPIGSTMIEFADGQTRRGPGAEELGEDRSPCMLMSTPVSRSSRTIASKENEVWPCRLRVNGCE